MQIISFVEARGQGDQSLDFCSSMFCGYGSMYKQWGGKVPKPSVTVPKPSVEGPKTLPRGTRRTTGVSNAAGGKDTIAGMLASLMEVVRTIVACECVYVRAMVIKGLIWMQSPHESFDELKSIVASELSDPAWPATLLNDVLLTLHARFKATPNMAVTLLELARIFATKVPGKIDADVLQLLWKTCLVGAGPDGKHTALEAVTIVLDLPPPQPGSMSGFTSVDRVSASDPKSALALQRLVQAAVWFLGENANYAASEYAWESAMPPGTALMMLDADKWLLLPAPVRIIAAQALTTVAIRSGEPFRLQIYEFLHALAQSGVQSQLSEMHLSNGEDQGASGTGLGVLITPMIKVLDEMYTAQDDLSKEIRNHDNANKEWKDEELKKLYETHERLLDLAAAESDTLDDDLVNVWAANLGDVPAVNRVNEFLAGAGTDAPDVDENIISRPSVVMTICGPRHFWRVQKWRHDFFQIPHMLINERSSGRRFNDPSMYEGYGSPDDDRVSSGNPQFGTALYDFTAGGDDELSLTTGEDVEIEYEVDGWFYVSSIKEGYEIEL
ncbi:hypothetical protein GQ457_13G027150 [Hibiscus cannabinus]